MPYKSSCKYLALVDENILGKKKRSTQVSFARGCKGLRKSPSKLYRHGLKNNSHDNKKCDKSGHLNFYWVELAARLQVLSDTSDFSEPL